MTREEAIKTLRELWRETNDHWYEETYSMAIEALERMPSADAPHWISCSERLPEEGQWCLVSDKGHIAIDTFIGHGNPYNWHWYVRDYEAWMPLPEPYKGGEQND